MAVSAAQQDITLITIIPAVLTSPSKIVTFPNRLYDTRFTNPTLKPLLSMGMFRGICCTQATFRGGANNHTIPTSLKNWFPYGAPLMEVCKVTHYMIAYYSHASIHVQWKVLPSLKVNSLNAFPTKIRPFQYA
jgi:hypothetical protein